MGYTTGLRRKLAAIKVDMFNSLRRSLAPSHPHNGHLETSVFTLRPRLLVMPCLISEICLGSFEKGSWVSLPDTLCTSLALKPCKWRLRKMQFSFRLGCSFFSYPAGARVFLNSFILADFLSISARLCWFIIPTLKKKQFTDNRKKEALWGYRGFLEKSVSEQSSNITLSNILFSFR